MLNFNMIKSMSNELSKSNTEAYAEWLDSKDHEPSFWQNLAKNLAKKIKTLFGAWGVTPRSDSSE